MRLLLDANLSPKRVGAALEAHGHEVLALAADPQLGALDDPEVLVLAADQRRILVTRNARDFAPLLREWAEEGREHAGCLLIWTLGHHEFGAIITAVRRCLEARPEAGDWRNLAVAV